MQVADLTQSQDFRRVYGIPDDIDDADAAWERDAILGRFSRARRGDVRERLDKRRNTSKMRMFTQATRNIYGKRCAVIGIGIDVGLDAHH